MNTLTPRERARLRSLAQSLKPILQVGKDGASQATVDAVRDAFNSRELLKIKVLDNSPDGADVAGRTIAAAIENAEVVQVIGRTVVLYRPSPDE